VHLALLAFGFGVAALFTPCVFPMIPLTISFFVGGQNTARGRGFRKAALFCGGIVVVFSILGIGVTALAGPFGVVRLSSSAQCEDLQLERSTAAKRRGK
jgi:thiol:disulfide interchange protein DsbD